MQKFNDLFYRLNIFPFKIREEQKSFLSSPFSNYISYRFSEAFNFQMIPQFSQIFEVAGWASQVMVGTQMDELFAPIPSLESALVLQEVLFFSLHCLTPTLSFPVESFPQVTPSVVNQMNLSCLMFSLSRVCPTIMVAPSIQNGQQLAEVVLTVVMSLAKHLTSASLTAPAILSVAIFSPIVLN